MSSGIRTQEGREGTGPSDITDSVRFVVEVFSPHGLSHVCPSPGLLGGRLFPSPRGLSIAEGAVEEDALGFAFRLCHLWAVRALARPPSACFLTGTLECNLGRYQSFQHSRPQVLLCPKVQSLLVLVFTTSLKEDSKGIHFIPKSSPS